MHPNRALYLGVTVLVGALVVGCAFDSAESVGTAASQATGDIASMTRRPDGNYDVVCADGRHEVASVAQIQDNTVCSGGSSGGAGACFTNAYQMLPGSGSETQAVAQLACTGG